MRQRAFIGIDNLNPEHALRPGHVRDAVNVDPQRNTGSEEAPVFTAASRKGRTSFYAGSNVHSLWGDGLLPFVLFVDAGTMYRLDAINATPHAVATVGSRRVSYARVNEAVYWCNTQAGGVITMDGEAYDWACPAPNGQPSLAVDEGSLPAGRYQVAVTYRDTLRREGGTGLAATIELASPGGIRLSNIPQPVSGDVTTVRVYLTGANGDVLYHARDITPGMTSAVLVTSASGKPLDTQFHSPLPYGHIVAYGHGRLWVADKSCLRWSNALRYAQGVMSANYVRLGNIAMIAPVGDGADGAGVFAATDKRTLWLGGADPSKFTQRIAYPHGVVAGTLSWSEADVWGFNHSGLVPSWLALNGQFCVGLPGGEVKVFNADTVAADVGERGASLVRVQDGQRHMLTSVNSPTSLGVADRAAAKVYRHGIEL